MTAFLRAQFHRGVSPAVLLLALLLVAGTCIPGVAQATILYTGSSSGANNGLPTNGTAGALTIAKPVGTVAGQALIATIAARPSRMTVTVPANWFPMTVTQQTAGGISTSPGGMTLLTYYHIVGVGATEPASYSWTFANPVLGTSAGSAVGGLLAFSGIDTSGGNPINVWSAKLTPSGTTHSTNAITPTVANTMIVSSISYLSGDSFANPTGITGIVERLDQRAPVAVNAVGTTLQMSTAPWTPATVVGPSRAVAASNADTGVGHLMALKPADIDPGITMVRSGVLNPGGTAFYTLTVTNNGLKPENGPITVVNTLPFGLTYNATGSGGTGWVCGNAGLVVTCTRAGALAGGTAAADLVLNVNVIAGATGTLTNTATVSGKGGDGNMANNTATDSYTLAVDLALTMSSGALNPGSNGAFTINVTNAGTLSAPSPVTVTDVLPAGLTYSGFSGGPEWTCSAPTQTVTCTRASALGNGAAAGTLTLNVAVAATVTTVMNTATVSGTAPDSDASNNSATVTYNVAADLSLTMVRSAALVPGTSAVYTLTVSNSAGSNSSPQPIIITDTLPAGLTFVSGVGTNWSCSAAGQLVTCTRIVTLAAGASSALDLTVAVTAGASGVITHTASVSGPAADGSPANNTATDNYTIALSAYAYYKMDEASWTGAANEVLDSSGNNRHASALGGLSTILAGAAGAKGDTCRSTSIPDDNAAATVTAVNTAIDINSLGSAGSISFWYKSRLAWNTGNGNNDDRTLFDATNAAGTGEFWLVLRDNGTLRFRLDNAGDNRQTIDTSAFARAAGTWVHVAATWSFTTNTMCVYVDGASAGCTNSANITSTANYSTLYVGDNKGSFTNSVNRGNSADGAIDELRMYASALTAAQITADKNATHACGVVAPDHIRLEHDGSAISCVAEAVVVKACANPTCSTLYTTGVTGLVTAGANSVGFAIPSGQSQTTINIHLPTDSALAIQQTVRLDAGSFSPVPTDAASPYCRNTVSGTVNTTTACDLSVNKAGFLFDVPNLIAGTAFGTVNVSAVSSNGSACVPLFQTVTRNVAFWGQYVDPLTGTMSIQVNGSAIETTATPTYASAYSLNFGATGVATLTSVQYDDVGQMRLNARYVGDDANTPADGGMIVTGSDTFVVKPHHFDLSGIRQTATPNLVNPAASNADGTKFVMAGEPFTAIVTARNALTPSGITPNYGQESTGESVKLTAAVLSGLGLTHNLTAVGGGFSDFGLNCDSTPGTAGTACSTELTWNEVGIITLTPSIASGNYLGVAGDTVGTTSGNVGRFYAAKFELTNPAIGNRADLATGSITSGSSTLTLASSAGVKVGGTISVAGAGTAGATLSSTVLTVSANGLTVTLATNAETTVTSSPVYLGVFTYIGEPVSALFTLTAKAVDGTTTLQNYTAANSFAKLSPMAAVTGGTGGPLGVSAVDSAVTRTPFTPCGAPSVHPCLTPAPATGTFVAGVANVTVPFTIYRDTVTPRGPYALLDIGVAPKDSDDAILAAYDLDTENIVADTTNHALVGRTQARFGQIKMQNMYGSERLPLDVPIQAQYYDATSGTFKFNTDDASTLLSVPPPKTMSTPDGSVGRFYSTDSKNKLVTPSPVPDFYTVAAAPVVTSHLVGGKANLHFPQPTVTGWLDIILDVPDYLKYNSGNCNGQVDNPVVVPPNPLPLNDFPCARATFGIYKSPLIYRRENY